MARLARAGADVEVLSVFAGDPESQEPANGWDRRGGFETAGAAAAARRAENKAACRIVGVRESALRFTGAGYGGQREPEEIWRAVAKRVNGANGVLIPGFPLTNDDHAWLHELLLGQRPPRVRIGLYAEQPYRYMDGRDPPPRLERPRPLPLDWKHPARVRDLPLKRRAILAYESQLPLLGLAAHGHRKLHRMLLHEVVHGGEAIAWLPS